VLAAARESHCWNGCSALAGAIGPGNKQSCSPNPTMQQQAAPMSACAACPSFLPLHTRTAAPCRYNGVEKFVRQNPEANAEVLDIEDLARIGESRTVCPYYLAR
jgi:hypothetical protein